MRFDAVECGKRIKALREEKRLTQMELAEQICITTDHLRAIERGRRACSIDLLVDLSLFFEVTLDHLILGRTPKFLRYHRVTARASPNGGQARSQRTLKNE